ncbi:hypothetical protein Q8F55_008492 [Vanrija albida]|uniref:Uncharacterized protein n=1 Tax=Vanrija albida TaxID=181172 RepID=A0ABR3PRC1_9TREE
MFSNSTFAVIKGYASVFRKVEGLPEDDQQRIVSENTILFSCAQGRVKYASLGDAEGTKVPVTTKGSKAFIEVMSVFDTADMFLPTQDGPAHDIPVVHFVFTHRQTPVQLLPNGLIMFTNPTSSDEVRRRTKAAEKGTDGGGAVGNMSSLTDDKAEHSAATGGTDPSVVHPVAPVHPDVAPEHGATTPSHAAAPGEEPAGAIFGPEIEGEAGLDILGLLVILMDRTSKNNPATGSRSKWLPSRGFLRSLSEGLGLRLSLPATRPTLTLWQLEDIIDRAGHRRGKWIVGMVIDAIGQKLDLLFEQTVRATEDQHFKHVKDSLLPAIIAELEPIADRLTPKKPDDANDAKVKYCTVEVEDELCKSVEVLRGITKKMSRELEDNDGGSGSGDRDNDDGQNGADGDGDDQGGSGTSGTAA